MQTVADRLRRFAAWWRQFLRSQSALGKLIFAGASLLLACFLCGVPLAIVSPAGTPTPAPIAAAATATPLPSETPIPPETPTPTRTPPSTPPPTLTRTPPPTETPIPPTPTPHPPTPTLPPRTPVPPLGAGATGQYPPMPDGLPSGTVIRVIDGDTIDVDLNGQVVRLQLIGMDAPETRAPDTPVQCYGPEASARADVLLTGLTVMLESDPTQGDRDAYDRLLRYVWFPDGRLYNLEMIREGYAHEYTNDNPYKYQAVFLAAEGLARELGLGFWSASTCAGNTEQPADGAAQPEAPAAPAPTAPR